MGFGKLETHSIVCLFASRLNQWQGLKKRDSELPGCSGTFTSKKPPAKWLNSELVILN